ncbi:dicarboxylate/amino acid:cation symporter [Vagococcus vulneris]|uniref:Na+:H+ dicarboxylate symporter n=1 Tax=Vagococcus vulneris TaxID=1977869 RepID=A0A429ZXG7_9ENTE|nr:dicarboxylate/amino acid:cation symporter [Vagococcus vulneris]RST98411.1 Na+:H+ dicarboxylate symporter [Vagococcus vulneris]
MSVLKNYKSSFFLLIGIIVGAVLGIMTPDFAKQLEPIGRLFLNFIFVLIIPLVFTSMVLAIVSNQSMERVKRILVWTLIVFVATILIATATMYIANQFYNPFDGLDVSKLKSGTEAVKQNHATESLGNVLVDTVSVSNFLDLFDKSHLLALIIFALFFGVGISLTGDKAQPLVTIIEALNEVILKLISLVMLVAPVGLGAYFAFTLSNLGNQVLGGYLKSLIMYILIAFFYVIVITSIYAFFGGGYQGFVSYWRNSLPAALQALGTSSSAACIPTNILALKKIGVPEDVRETVISLGANVHKDGSAMTGVLEVVLLFSMFGRELNSLEAAMGIIAGGFLVGVVMGAVPSGGFTAEVLLISLFGLPIEAIPMMAVISTITDMFATTVNSLSNITCGMMVTRFIEGRDWLKS